MTDNSTKEECEKAFCTIAYLISKVEKAGAQFVPGTSQHTLQKNRLAALNIALVFVSKELSGSATPDYSKEELEKAVAPIASLISKSEKARDKLVQGSWQHTMLSDNLKALSMASPLLTKALREKCRENGVVSPG